MNEDVVQMQQQQQQQQLRFPTPPITPPRSFSSAEQQQQPQPVVDHHSSHHYHLTTTPKRTQSVIMRIGYDQSPHHLPADLPYTTATTHHHTADNHQHQPTNPDTPTSANSSPSSNSDFVCDWIDCGRYFESLEFLAIHVTQIHAVASVTDGLYYCRWSGCHRTQKGFNARYKMLVHVRTHTKEKPHQCHLCSKRFSRAENLKIHARSHSGEKPYICSFEGCNKAYSNSSDRFKHTRTHFNGKPYICKVPGCNKRYTDPSSLRKHVKTFRHSVQIRNTNDSTPPPTNYHQLQYNPNQNSLDESRFSPLENAEQAYPSYHLIMTAAAPTTVPGHDSFCMAMEEMCHIRATLDCYKTTPTPVDSHNYWLHDEITDKNPSPSTFHSHFHTPTISQEAELTLDLTSDKPLDLRVKRCSS
ncbi:sugarbabe isoform X2 [Haematobia irritans]